MVNKTKNIELAIIGGGIAGVSAAVYAKRSGLDFIIFEPKAIGGQLLLMEGIDNYVGLKMGSKGRNLAASLESTLSDLEITITKEEVLNIEIVSTGACLHTADNNYCAKAIIIATGAYFKKLGVKGENEFSGKGVSYCAVCDGFFFKGKDIIVVGGGNAAVEEALYLCEIAGKVTLIHRRDELRALDYLQKDLFSRKNVEVIFDSVIKEVKGENTLSEIIIENTKTNRQKSIAAKGLFVAIGVNPNTEVFSGKITSDNEGFIITDEQMKSSSDFIWAAGDCRKRPLRQLITAASEGAIAAISAYKHLKGHYISA